MGGLWQEKAIVNDPSYNKGAPEERTDLYVRSGLIRICELGLLLLCGHPGDVDDYLLIMEIIRKAVYSAKMPELQRINDYANSHGCTNLGKVIEDYEHQFVMWFCMTCSTYRPNNEQSCQTVIKFGPHTGERCETRQGGKNCIPFGWEGRSRAPPTVLDPSGTSDNAPKRRRSARQVLSAPADSSAPAEPPAQAEPSAPMMNLLLKELHDAREKLRSGPTSDQSSSTPVIPMEDQHTTCPICQDTVHPSTGSYPLIAGEGGVERPCSGDALAKHLYHEGCLHELIVRKGPQCLVCERFFTAVKPALREAGPVADNYSNARCCICKSSEPLEGNALIFCECADCTRHADNAGEEFLVMSIHQRCVNSELVYCWKEVPAGPCYFLDHAPRVFPPSGRTFRKWTEDGLEDGR